MTCKYYSNLWSCNGDLDAYSDSAHELTVCNVTIVSLREHVNRFYVITNIKYCCHHHCERACQHVTITIVGVCAC